MKPRVVSYYETRFQGRNDGNPFYVTYVMQRDWKDRIDYLRLVPDPEAMHDVFGRFDLHLWIDWAEDALAREGILPYQVIDCPHPSFYWASDVHLGYDYRMRMARTMDYVGVAQRDYVARFRADGVTAPLIWLPHAVEPDCYNPLGVFTHTPELREQAPAGRTMKTHDVSFIGYLTFPHRQRFLDALFRGVNAQGRSTWYAWQFFEAAARVYTQSKIVVNHAVNQDLNMRVFEVLATRSFLLTPDVPGLQDLFTDGVHLVTYRDGDVDDALAKIDYYADREDERERIAEAGYREVLAKHTFQHRVGRMLELAGLGGRA